MAAGWTLLKYHLDKKRDNFGVELLKKDLKNLEKDIEENKILINDLNTSRKSDIEKLDRKIEKLQEERAQLYEKMLEWMVGHKNG